MVKKRIVSLALAGALGSFACGAVVLVLTPAHAVPGCPPSPSNANPNGPPTYQVSDPYGGLYYKTSGDVYVGESQSNIPVAGSGFAEAGYNSTTGAYVETQGSNQFSSGYGGVGTNNYLCHS